MGHKILHRKQKYKQWATTYYTENKNRPIVYIFVFRVVFCGPLFIFVAFCVVFCGPLFIFFVLCSILNILHRKQKYKQWATKYYTENKNINNGPQNTTQKTKNINNVIFLFSV
jgi:hypothetical protein